ncbi:MAG: EAL domain-containing protein, partial [Burkholderiales bacterium]
YSSLAHLQHFPLSKVKIDRYFTRRVPDDADASAITRGMVALARELRLKTIADGVKTQPQFTFMKAAGCDEYVGPLLGSALPAPDFEERWLRPTLSVG